MVRVLNTARPTTKLCLLLIAISTLVSGPFGFFVSMDPVSGFFRGAFTGAAIATPIALFEVLYLRGSYGRPLRESPLWVLSVVRTGWYAIATLVGEVLARLAFLEPLAFDAALLRTFLFSVAISLTLNFVLVINQLLGQNVLFNLLIGHYHRPREENRIFLFVDMIGSTAIAEQLGSARFISLLNQCIFDITTPILRHGGEIYRYVGDEVIVTWKTADAEDNARALACAREISETIAAARPSVKSEYEVNLGFRMALHAGPVITGEIGDYKREITFVGDTMNTTARIEQMTKAYKEEILASGDYLNSAAIAADPEIVALGDVVLQGKNKPVSLFAVRGTASD